jgi:hypothetical protein
MNTKNLQRKKISGRWIVIVINGNQLMGGMMKQNQHRTRKEKCLKTHEQFSVFSQKACMDITILSLMRTTQPNRKLGKFKIYLISSCTIIYLTV